MSSITQSAGGTLVAMLNAVSTTANTLTRTVHTTASALDMLDQYVQDARVEQIARSVAAREDLLVRIKEESTMGTSKRQADLQRQLQSDPALHALYSENDKLFSATMDKINAKLATLDNRNSI